MCLSWAYNAALLDMNLTYTIHQREGWESWLVNHYHTKFIQQHREENLLDSSSSESALASAASSAAVFFFLPMRPSVPCSWRGSASGSRFLRPYCNDECKERYTMKWHAMIEQCICTILTVNYNARKFNLYGDIHVLSSSCINCWKHKKMYIHTSTYLIIMKYIHLKQTHISRLVNIYHTCSTKPETSGYN